MANVEGKVVLVSGGARSMGRAHCELLAKGGAKVVIGDILDEDGEAAAKAIGGNARYVHLDVTKEADWIKAVGFAEDTFGPITALVNNAGIGYPAGLEISEAEYRKFVDVNQVGAFLGMKSVLPSMRKRTSGGASIINISSTAGLRALPGSFPYVATKFAVTGMSKSAALDLGPEGIRVNSVHPGTIGDTTMLIANKDYIQPVIDKTPLRRVAKLSEITSLIEYLVSDESGYCTGGEFVADGGVLCLH
ncbi:MAG: SDR family oxidoreductase [Caulobacterales bacterium]